MFILNTSSQPLTIVAEKAVGGNMHAPADLFRVLSDLRLKAIYTEVGTFAGTKYNTCIEFFNKDTESRNFVWVQERISEIKLSSTAPANNDIASVVNPDDIEVANGTVVGSVPLPETVVVNFADGQETLAVTWDSGTPSYDGDTAGEYVFEGTITLPDGITNTESLTASVTVTVLEAE